MHYKEYKAFAYGPWGSSVGMFGKHIHAYQNPTGVTDTPEYHKISKDEFGSYEKWKADADVIRVIVARPVFCSGHDGRSDFDEEEIINSTW